MSSSNKNVKSRKHYTVTANDIYYKPVHSFNGEPGGQEGGQR